MNVYNLQAYKIHFFKLSLLFDLKTLRKTINGFTFINDYNNYDS